MFLCFLTCGPVCLCACACAGLSVSGHILPSILVVFGSHCRLENLSASGHFLQSEQFTLGDHTVSREAGQSAGNLMAGWRAARASRPELFQSVRVWQSPTAFVDSVIWRWQQELEASEFVSQVRIVGAFRTAWTDQAQEVSWLTNAAQVCVAPGCTPLSQVTDTGLAMPAKAAARQEQDRLKTLLLLKARQEKTTCQFRVGPAEILGVANAMHSRMASLNAERQTVLAEGIACGWLAYRPVQGRMVPVSEQSWASGFPLTSSRLDQGHLADRYSFLDSTGKPTLLDSQEKTLQAVQPQELQTSYFEPDCKDEAAQPLDLGLTLSTALAASDEALHCLTHTVHPALRDKQASINAELAQLCSQRTRGQPAKTYAGLDRADKVALWRKSLGRSSLEKRLAACIVALPGKKGAKTQKPSGGQYSQAGQRTAATFAVEQAAESVEALAGHRHCGAGARLPAPPSDQPVLPHWD